jgi:hypothetical protein
LLAWIAEYQWLTLPVDASRLCGGKRMAYALADYMSLVLGGSGEHVKRSRFAPACRGICSPAVRGWPAPARKREAAPRVS